MLLLSDDSDAGQAIDITCVDIDVNPFTSKDDALSRIPPKDIQLNTTGDDTCEDSHIAMTDDQTSPCGQIDQCEIPDESPDTSDRMILYTEEDIAKASKVIHRMSMHDTSALGLTSAEIASLREDIQNLQAEMREQYLLLHNVMEEKLTLAQ